MAVPELVKFTVQKGSTIERWSADLSTRLRPPAGAVRQELHVPGFRIDESGQEIIGTRRYLPVSFVETCLQRDRAAAKPTT
jgi:hypothetical protein